MQSYDARRSYDTTYSQNESQIVIVSYVRYDHFGSRYDSIFGYGINILTRFVNMEILIKVV